MSDNVFGNPFGDVSYISSNPSRVGQTTALSSFSAELIDAATMTIQALNDDELPTELDAKRKALLVEVEESATDTKDPSTGPDEFEMDTIFSFRAEFGGFLCSLVDSGPSEIAVASLRNVNALARWTKSRTKDASVLLSIGWLQIDNHIPSAPFKVAVRPDMRAFRFNDGKKDVALESDSDKEDDNTSPLLVLALAFAPKHNSGIVVSTNLTYISTD